jgi:hypothetical protein
MNDSNNKNIRTQRRRAFAWIACFAVLFAGLVMPMTPTMPRTQGEQVVWGTFCTGAGAQRVATPIGVFDQGAPQQDDHASMQHCWCCSGGLSLLAVPSGMSVAFFAHAQPVRFPISIVVFHAPPRQQWPSVNPRASPRV